ncbi:MAG: dihydropteroate synthase [Dehalococcoidia bacterium]|nr:dihydropteroate synthase [Dehalococcoidia bacterium]
MIIVGENINIMSATLGSAMREYRAEPVRAISVALDRAGVDYLELNIGPAKKAGAELMPWLINIVQGVTSRPISLDTTNPEAIEAGLKLVKGRALINSVSLQPERLERILPLVTRYDTKMIGLLWGIEGMPRDTSERCLLAVDLAYKANELGIKSEDIWMDPIATPVSGDISQVVAVGEFLQMLPEICPGCKSIVGLSNVSNGTPTHLRPYLNRTYLVMLERYGLYAAIADALDNELLAIARGDRPSIVNLIHLAMDSEYIDLDALSDEEAKYVKTVRVLNGTALYSHAWLEA